MIKKQSELDKKAEKAMREAVKGVVLEHKKNGQPLAIWKQGKVMSVSAKNLRMR